jgi:calcium-dependent protein kinase
MVTLSMTPVVSTGPTKKGFFGQSRAGQYRGKRLMNPSLEDTIRICDFGTSVKFTPGKHMTELVGTPTHIAPQVLRKSYTEACDMWSCGVILFNLVSGALPFTGNSDEEVLQKVRTGSPKFGKEFVDASGPALEIVRQILSEPRSRPPAQKALQHKWMTKLLAKRQANLKPDIVSCLRGYRALNKFKRASLSVMAVMMPEEKVRPARVAFQALDIDSDGTVSLEEIRVMMEKMRFKKAEVNETLHAISADYHSQYSQESDQDVKRSVSVRMTEKAKSSLMKQSSFMGDQSMPPFSFSEFLGATLDRSVRLDENLCRAAFNMFDKDGSGKISTEELLDGSIFGDLSEEEVAQMVEELDVNGDGEIDFAEFMEAVEGQSAKHFGSQVFPAIRQSELETDTCGSLGRLGHTGRGGGF